MNIVFSYGSNSIAQLRARVENPLLLAEPAKAVDWQRIFCVRTITWGGAAASVIPHEGGVTYGAVVTLSDDELTRLDRFEGGYHKEELQVYIYRENVWVLSSALVYISNSLHWTDPPSEAYLCAIHVNLREQFNELMPEVAANVPIYGAFATSGSFVPSAPKTINFDDTCSDMVGSKIGTPGQYVDMTQIRVELISEWRFPGTWALTLPALCVEVNAARVIKWVMPRAVAGVIGELKGLGILSASQLAAKLAVGWTFENLCSEDKVKIQYLDAEAVELFRKLLHI